LSLFCRKYQNPVAASRHSPPTVHHSAAKPACCASCEPPIGPITCATLREADLPPVLYEVRGSLTSLRGMFSDD